ncbi:GWxTD domain-containing protein [Candidatus Dependentiae bacterium]|nr:GWxTD domain-containing protein [Candidatus Dependentiae bacterium]
MRNYKKFNLIIFLIFIFLGTILFQGCTNYRLERKLDKYEKDEFAMMKIFAYRREYVGYLKAEPEHRPEYAENFWKMYDPEIETKRNDFYIELKRRFRYADKKYKELKTPGHMTARGRIYIMFGPPDDITRGRYRPSLEETRGLEREYFSETWYYAYPKKLEFLFIDEMGLGAFTQVKNMSVSGAVPGGGTPVPDVRKKPYRLRSAEEVKKLKKEGYFK